MIAQQVAQARVLTASSAAAVSEEVGAIGAEIPTGLSGKLADLAQRISDLENPAD